MAEGHRGAARSVLDGGEHGATLDQVKLGSLPPARLSGSLLPRPNRGEPENPSLDPSSTVLSNIGKTVGNA